MTSDTFGSRLIRCIPILKHKITQTTHTPIRTVIVDTEKLRALSGRWIPNFMRIERKATVFHNTKNLQSLYQEVLYTNSQITYNSHN